MSLKKHRTTSVNNVKWICQIQPKIANIEFTKDNWDFYCLKKVKSTLEMLNTSFSKLKNTTESRLKLTTACFKVKLLY